MTTATAPQPEVRAYLDEVRRALDDLPEVERDDLLVEVEASLVDAAAEGGSLAARLGPASEFASELRSAAGLHVVARPGPTPQFARLRGFATELAANSAFVAARRVARELAPIWWVVRGYLAVAVVTFAIDATWSSRLPFVPNGFGTAATGALFILLAVALSVALGLATRGLRSTSAVVVAFVDVALLVAAVPALQEALDASGRPAYIVPEASSSGAAGLLYDGVPVDNIYPYSREGKLLHDVLLYDGAGRPIEIGSDLERDPLRRVVVTKGHQPLSNVFPIRYYEPGTKRVARPDAAPPVELPRVLTPPLRRR